MQSTCCTFLIAVFTLLLAGCTTPPATQIVVDGTTFHHLQAVAKQLGGRLAVDKHSGQFALSSAASTLTFSSSLPLLQANGTAVPLRSPLLLVEGEPYLAEYDFAAIITPLLAPQALQPRRKVQRILIDPGHGGHDPGATNRAAELEEKNLTLALGRELFFLLQQQGYTVATTRSSDTFVPLAKRPMIADDFAADLFVSLHFNSANNAHAQGVECFVLAPPADGIPLPGNAYDAYNHLLAFTVQRAIVEQLQCNDRGIKHARFAVLRPLNCPGLLIEAGFISNAEEAQRIRDPHYFEQLARAIAEGIHAYAIQSQ